MIQIREMQVRDTNAVAEIERQIFSQPWSRQGFLDAVNLGNTVFLVAEENNRIKGSDTVLPIAQQTAERFMKLNPNARVTVTEIGRASCRERV